MIRAVLDTNVLASGFAAFADPRRAPSELLRRWRDRQFQLVVSPEIVDELLRTLNTPYFQRKLSEAQIEAAGRLIREEAAIAPPTTLRITGVATHAEDDQILAAALSAEVDYLVTGDKKLLAMGTFKGIELIAPREFLAILEMGSLERS